MCTFVQSVYVYTVSYPAIAAFLLTISVSIYVFIMVNKLNSINPHVSLPVTGRIINILPVNQETSGPSTSGNTGMSQEAELGIKPLGNEDAGSFNEEDAEINKSNKTKEGDEIILSAVDLHDNGANEEIHVLKMITEMERTDTNTSVGHHEMVCSSSRHEIETRKSVLYKTLKMNLFTLAILFITVPTSILNIIYENCNHLSGECDFYFSTMIVSSLSELVISFFQPLVYLFFLDQNN
jgi:hypothetical protein